MRERVPCMRRTAGYLLEPDVVSVRDVAAHSHHPLDVVRQLCRVTPRVHFVHRQLVLVWVEPADVHGKLSCMPVAKSVQEGRFENTTARTHPRTQARWSPGSKALTALPGAPGRRAAYGDAFAPQIGRRRV
eukprot:350699-Chlamydomonas_euryale.AAC.6